VDFAQPLIGKLGLNALELSPTALLSLLNLYLFAMHPMIEHREQQQGQQR
jgi:hypothetical protein